MLLNFSTACSNHIGLAKGALATCISVLCYLLRDILDKLIRRHWQLIVRGQFQVELFLHQGAVLLIAEAQGKYPVPLLKIDGEDEVTCVIISLTHFLNLRDAFYSNADGHLLFPVNLQQRQHGEPIGG